MPRIAVMARITDIDDIRDSLNTGSVNISFGDETSGIHANPFYTPIAVNVFAKDRENRKMYDNINECLNRPVQMYLFFKFEDDGFPTSFTRFIVVDVKHTQTSVTIICRCLAGDGVDIKSQNFYERNINDFFEFVNSNKWKFLFPSVGAIRLVVLRKSDCLNL